MVCKKQQLHSDQIIQDFSIQIVQRKRSSQHVATFRTYYLKNHFFTFFKAFANEMNKKPWAKRFLSFHPNVGQKT